jgi:hypothetical protein
MNGANDPNLTNTQKNDTPERLMMGTWTVTMILILGPQVGNGDEEHIAIPRPRPSGGVYETVIVGHSTHARQALANPGLGQSLGLSLRITACTSLRLMPIRELTWTKIPH